MSPTVYVVTTGSYSDYGIRGMFSTKEKAQAFIEATHHGDVNDIEKYRLDANSEDIQRGLSPWRVLMAKDGTVRRAGLASYDFDSGCEWWCSFPRSPESVVELSCTCWAKDEQHAIKIANEKRAQIIAMNLWRDVADMPKKSATVRVDV